MRTRQFIVPYPKRSAAAFIGVAAISMVVYSGYRWRKALPEPYERIVMHAEEMTAHRFHPRDVDYNTASIADYEPVTPPVAVDDSLRALFADVLAGEPSPEAPACVTTPGVGTSMTRDNDELDVIICLTCGWLVFVSFR